MKKLVGLLAITIILFFSFSLSASRINVGMTKQEVIEIMGQPDQTKTKGGYEGLRYVAKGSAQLDRHTIYHVILKDGKVVEHGAGIVKIEKENGDIIMFLPFE